jgi:nucleoside-diphosphate-sugar epimerase
MPHTVVTGANSFVAAHIIEVLLAQGHTVTGTVREASSGEAVLALHPEWKGKVDFALIEDYSNENVWSSIFQKAEADGNGFQHVVHVAAPLLDDQRNTDYDNDFIKTSVEG